ncbi:hypothetical protein PIB30_035448 [Stylosanthes scabra]|uniref:Sporozoite surface protein 2-like n=1 Tax=Stylosanthes scabra TaxID=79078 RepID=A0ABU6UEF6_9FABA|nr:hypothetical protein [Stylosanthes scabra]
MASFSYVVLFAFFLLSSHLFGRQLPNENRFSISNKPQWTIPLTATEITKDYHSTTPSVEYYSKDSNQDSNPILPMLFFSKKKKPKVQQKTKTSPKIPPHEHKPPPDQNPETHHEQNPPHHEQVPHPHPHQHHPPYQPDPYNDYNDPPNYYERRRPFGSNLPPITPFIEPFLRKPNQDDPESEDTDDDPESENTDPESKKTNPKSKKNTDSKSKKTYPESKKSAPESKKDPPPDDEEEEDSLDNTAHLTGYYHPLEFENLEERFPTHNMKANVLKGSTNNLQWRIPLTPSIVEKDHYTTSQRDYNVHPPILGMLFLPRHPPSHPDRLPSKWEKFREAFDWFLEKFEWFEQRIKELIHQNSEPTPPNEKEGSMDNFRSSIGYNPYYSGYQPSDFEDSGKRFQAAYNNMEEVDELKGSNNKLQWDIPFTPTEIEKDHFTTPSVGNYNSWNSHPSRTLILPMLFSSEKNQPKEPQTDPHGPNIDPHGQHDPHARNGPHSGQHGSQTDPHGSHDPNIDPHGQYDPHTPNGPHSGQHVPHGPHGSHNDPYGPHTSPHDPYNNDPYNGRYGPHTDPRDPYNNDPYNSRYGPHTGPRDRYDNPYDDPYDDDPYGSNTRSYPNRPRFIDPNDLPRIWETIKDTAKKGWEWLHPNPAKSSESPPSDEEKEEGSLDSTHFDQPSGFHDIENHED